MLHGSSRKEKKRHSENQHKILLREDIKLYKTKYSGGNFYRRSHQLT